MNSVGLKDSQSVVRGGARAHAPKIAGVAIHELGNVLTRSGCLTEIFRSDWLDPTLVVQQVNWVMMNPGGVTDWHCHAEQVDHIVGVGGTIKLAIWDDRETSPTRGATEIVRIGAMRPVLVVVPPRIWHGLRNESGTAAGYINLIDRVYAYEQPDNFRISPGSREIPDIL